MTGTYRYRETDLGDYTEAVDRVMMMDNQIIAELICDWLCEGYDNDWGCLATDLVGGFYRDMTREALVCEALSRLIGMWEDGIRPAELGEFSYRVEGSA